MTSVNGLASYNPDRHQRRLFRWALLAAFLLCVALIVNYFRQPLFGIIPGYASQNFSFNFIFFIPMALSATLIAYFVVGQTLLNWRRLGNSKKKFFALLLTLPILVLFMYSVYRLFRNG